MPRHNRGFRFGFSDNDAQDEQKNATEADVIAYIVGLNDEEYKKTLKKFTAHRELAKKLRDIEDGDIEDVANSMEFEGQDAQKGANNG